MKDLCLSICVFFLVIRTFDFVLIIGNLSAHGGRHLGPSFNQSIVAKDTTCASDIIDVAVDDVVLLEQSICVISHFMIRDPVL